MSNWIVALPIFNEESHVNAVLDEVLTYASQVVVVDDGSSDQTAQILQSRDDVTVLTHQDNQGYGAALQTAFDYAIKQGVEAIVTIDCDGQHQPKLIPQMIDELFSHELSIDIVSGSRYLSEFASDKAAPEDRRRINFEITKQLNEKLNLKLTDTFCGFKAYRVSALKKLSITDTGYAMPLQFWVQAACANLKIVEFPVPRIYLEEERSFGGSLGDARVR
ncbi:MAG: glycosyltransferase family 2 protein, partial [Planctomycetaceae bacterium]|nr:glycosyltransferase family 2 protein [Planctomycetaceae bacterium]